MQPLLVANLKCNIDSQDMRDKHARDLKQAFSGYSGAELVIAPAHTDLHVYRDSLPASMWSLGAQDCHYEMRGSYTGDISAKMLAANNVRYVIVGHSERRSYHGEHDDIVVQKAARVLQSDMTPIFCVGGGDMALAESKRVEASMALLCEHIDAADLERTIIAYEPVDAIGSGNAASGDEILTTTLLCRKVIAGCYNNEIAQSVRFLYGGSATAENARRLMADSGVDGLLVGSASLKPKQFRAMADDLNEFLL